ncbi:MULTISPECIES: porin [unclassified Undibacterium]|uniref:porin n=2 Tax=Pseudomonadota TaxID=1224 RepID=UPI002AC9850B|nr:MULTISPECIES: porin [unclassified Undibacterium]MEB0138307.1 porin [Undibacterium sp. CCC2.1]MEB0170793.1 porin [Undibacterium sp. CCC1.1]MEB0174682.1 porin [Undibacterium sp. CCC3.4]MEB0213879.1 porin [Undibacterium sp. 5I2]WPX42605.1 porin [Undibacterium sp. CCC3.4]
MKKQLIALACLGSVADLVVAQSKVDVYGILDSGLAYTTAVAAPTADAPTAHGGRAVIHSGLLQASRFGFRGSESLGGNLKALFVLEGGLNLDTGTSGQGGAIFGRRSVLGLVGDHGDLQLGRRKDFSDEIASQYSSITPFGTFITAVHGNNLDRIGGNRANNMVYYSTPTMHGFRANITYGFGESVGSNTIGQSLGLGGNYADGPFAIGAAYWQSRKGNVTQTANSSSDQGASSGAGCHSVDIGRPGDVCIKTWIAGARYKWDKLSVRGTYSRVIQGLIVDAGPAAPDFVKTFKSTAGSGAFTAGGSNNRHIAIVDVGLDYLIGNKGKLKASYIQSRYDFVGANDTGTLAQIIVGGEYYLSKRTTLYATASTMTASNMYSPGILNGAPGGADDTAAFGAGLRIVY